MRLLSCFLLAVALTSTAFAAAPPAQPSPSGESRAEQRFPQAVRAGDLVGRRLLAPEESQPVLGWVTGVVRDSDGDPSLIVEIGGWLGGWIKIGTRKVAVSADTMALLGEHVALLDLTPKELNALPTYTPGSQTPVGPNEILHMGIVKPFH